jgi:arylsulfatase A-like enzyme/cytochrome c-type biogenesis protein CcmH/NrfG
VRAFSIVFLCSAGIVLLSGYALAEDKPIRPDVFLITIDTLRADHVHCYGYDQIETVTLDRLARGGIRFAKAFTPSPITNTSHVSILTGLLPSNHGVTDFGIPLAVPRQSTLAELLGKNGYQTAAFIGSVILDSKRLAPGLDRGFDFYDNFPENLVLKSRWGRIERRGMDVVQRAEKWMDGHRTSSRFIWVHLYDPHDPYEPPPPYSEAYRRRPYDGEIAYADAALGQFFTYLKAHNWYDGALIIVVGDHGEGLGQHHEDTHGIFLYDSTTHVPLIVKLPAGRNADKSVEAQVSTIDIMPTVLDLLRIPAPARLDGVSLEQFIDGLETAPRTVFGETDYPLRFGWAPLRSIQEPGHKFIEAPQPEFYDLHSDPGELHNLYEPWDTMVQTLRKELTESSTQSRASQKTSSPGAVLRGTLDELTALGYLGPADSQGSTYVPEPSLLPDPKGKIEEQNLLHISMIATEDGQPGKARAALEKLLKMDPSSSAALSQLGRLELAVRNYPKAVVYLRRASELHPDAAAAVLDYGKALDLSGDLRGARDALEASLKLNPNQYDARVMLGSVYNRLNDLKAAQDQLETAVLLQPSRVEAQIGLAKLLITRRDFTAAAEQLEVMAQSDGKNAELFKLLAQAYAGLGERRKALQAEARAKAIATSRPQ